MLKSIKEKNSFIDAYIESLRQPPEPAGATRASSALSRPDPSSFHSSGQVFGAFAPKTDYALPTDVCMVPLRPLPTDRKPWKQIQAKVEQHVEEFLRAHEKFDELDQVGGKLQKQFLNFAVTLLDSIYGRPDPKQPCMQASELMSKYYAHAYPYSKYDRPTNRDIFFRTNIVWQQLSYEARLHPKRNIREQCVPFIKSIEKIEWQLAQAYQARLEARDSIKRLSGIALCPYDTDLGAGDLQLIMTFLEADYRGQKALSATYGS